MEQPLVGVLHAVRPRGTAIVRASLVKQYALDDSYILRSLGRIHEVAKRVVVVLLGIVLQPGSLLLDVVRYALFLEHVDGTSAQGNIDYSDGDAVRCVSHHVASEGVAGG